MLVILVLVAIATVTGVAAGGASAATPAADKVVLKIGWIGDLDNMNPFIGWTNNVYEIYANEYLLLVNVDPETMLPGSNGVAKSWEVAPDGLDWTFHLNEGITWHDGEPLTAEDVAWTYNFIIENEVSAYVAFTQGIKKVEVVDPYTAKFVCSEPKANLLRLFIPILPKHIWSKVDPKKATTSWPNNPPIVGSGPFQVTEWKRSEYLKMEANPDFYLGKPKIDEILYISYKNSDTMVQDLKTGTIDAAYLVPPAQFDSLKNDPNLEAASYTWRNWDYIGLNCYTGPSKGHPALRDKDFRAALEYAIDRDNIVAQAYSSLALPGWSFMPSGSWKDPDYHWEPDATLRRDYNVEKANEMLDAGGYKDTDGDGIREYGGKPIKLRLLANTRSPEAERSGKLISGYWKAIGIDVKYQIVDNAVYFDLLWNYDGDTFKPDYDAYIWQWDGYLDPGQTLDCFTTDQIEGWNEMAWSNQQYDGLNELQNKTLDVNQRADYIRQMQQVMYEDAATIVLTYPYKLQVYHTDKWQGWERALGGKGPAVVSATYPWAYMNVEPKVAEAGTGTSSTSYIILGVVVAVALVAGVVLLILRRRARTVEE